MKGHLPLVIASLTVAVTLGMTSWFVPHVRKIQAAQSRREVRLPAGPQIGQIATKPGELRIKFTKDGSSYEGELLSDSALAELISRRSGKRITVEAAPDVKYDDLRAFLRKVYAAGARDIAFDAGLR